MQQIDITVAGWVATDPRIIEAPSGSALCSFRMASTIQYDDPSTGEVTSGKTEWFTVRVTGVAASCVHASIHKGEPVFVVGRLLTHEWASEEGARTDLIVDAAHIGHDLTVGVATFTRVSVAASRDAA